MAQQPMRIPTWPEARALKGVENKVEWEQRMQAYLKMMGLWEVVSRGVEGAAEAVGEATNTASARASASDTASTHTDEGEQQDNSAPLRMRIAVAGQQVDVAGVTRLPSTPENLLADVHAHAFISTTLATPLLHFSLKYQTAKGLWDALQRRYSDRSSATKARLKRQMSSLRMLKGDSIEEYIDTASALRDRLVAAGWPCSDRGGFQLPSACWSA